MKTGKELYNQMDFQTLIRQRCSCRSYRPKPVEKEKLEQCMEAARLAPSGCNSQAWRYYVVTEPETKKQFADAVYQSGFNRFAEQAPVLIAITEQIPAKVMRVVREKYGTQAYVQIDIGLSLSQLILQATELGLATCILGIFDEDAVHALIPIPEGEKLRLVLALGYPAEEDVPEKNRHPLTEICQFIE